VTGAHGRIAVAADLLGRSGDLAGWSATHSITAAIEILRSDLPAATEAAARAAAAQVQLGPGAQRGITWHKVVHAACLVALGRGAEAQQPIGLARGELRALGSRRCSDYLDAIAKRAQSPSA
jgi:hypothetical protein